MTAAEVCNKFRSVLDNGAILFDLNGELYFDIKRSEYSKYVISVLKKEGYEEYMLKVNSTTSKNTMMYGTVMVKPIKGFNMPRYLEEEMLNIISIPDALSLPKKESAGLYDHTYKLFMKGAIKDKVKELVNAGLTEEEIARVLLIDPALVKKALY